MLARPMQVAILDDDQSVQTALGRFLKAAGMAVAAYGTSDQLFESLARESPDCLLLDYQMPGMNGLDVLRHMGERDIHIPTILMTAHDEAGLRPASLSAGAITYLNKPLDPEKLMHIIERISASRSEI